MRREDVYHCPRCGNFVPAATTERWAQGSEEVAVARPSLVLCGCLPSGSEMERLSRAAAARLGAKP